MDDAGQLKIDIAFAAESIVFDMNGFSVSPLTCSKLDESWSLQMPEMTTSSANGDIAGVDVDIELLNEELFDYNADEGLVTLTAADY